MRPRPDNDRRLLGFAREMRTAPSEAERKLWQILRSRKLSGFKFRRQHRVARYILDYYCISERLTVESDGGQHNEPDSKEYDARRTASLSEQGIRVIRFWANDVLKHPGVVAESIYRALTLGKPSPQPSPGAPGEGESRSTCV